jgi:hypothetical protein
VQVKILALTSTSAELFMVLLINCTGTTLHLPL